MTDTTPPSLPEHGLRVIPRDAHGISRKQMSPNALRVLYRLREAGFGGYLVAAWLTGIITNLLMIGDYYDIALRDFGLLLAALTLARLATAAPVDSRS